MNKILKEAESMMPEMKRRNSRLNLMKSRKREFMELVNSSYWDYLTIKTKCDILSVLLEIESDQRVAS